MGTDQADQLREQLVEAQRQVWAHPLVAAARQREEDVPKPEAVDRAMWMAVHRARAAS